VISAVKTLSFDAANRGVARCVLVGRVHDHDKPQGDELCFMIWLVSVGVDVCLSRTHIALFYPASSINSSLSSLIGGTKSSFRAQL
jgi:hypothetical protein